MEVYAESLATKGHRQLDRSLVDLDPVTLKLPQKETADSGLVEHTQDNMESLEQLVFAYQHNEFDVGNFGKVDGHNHYDKVDTAAHYLQRLVVHILGKLIGIAVVGIAPAMVVKPWAVVQY